MPRKQRRVSSLDGGVEVEELSVIQHQQSVVAISNEGALGFEFGIDCNSGRVVLLGIRRPGLIAKAAPGLLKYLDRLDAIGDMSEHPHALSAEHDFRRTRAQAVEYKRVHETSTQADQEETAKLLVKHAVAMLTTTPRPYTLLFHRPTFLKNTADVRRKQTKAALSAFLAADTDGSGEVELEELIAILPADTNNRTAAEALMKEFDTDGNGRLNRAEFIRLQKHLWMREDAPPNPAAFAATNRDIIVSSVATLRKRRKARRMSTSGPSAVRHIEGMLLKKSKQGRWQQRFFATASHYLMYKKSAKSDADFIGGIDLAWSGTSITLTTHLREMDTPLAFELEIIGLDGDAHDKGVMHRERRTFTLRSTAENIPSLQSWYDALEEVRAGLAAKSRMTSQLLGAAAVKAARTVLDDTEKCQATAAEQARVAETLRAETAVREAAQRKTAFVDEQALRAEAVVLKAAREAAVLESNQLQADVAATAEQRVEAAKYTALESLRRRMEGMRSAGEARATEHAALGSSAVKAASRDHGVLHDSSSDDAQPWPRGRDVSKTAVSKSGASAMLVKAMESTFGDEPHGRGMRKAIVSKSEAAALLVHALHVACGAGDATRAAAALDAGAALEQRTHGVTPLESAVLAGSVAIVELLLAKGADPNLCDPAYPGATPLCIALNQGKGVVARCLIAHGALVSVALASSFPDGSGSGPPTAAVVVVPVHRFARMQLPHRASTIAFVLDGLGPVFNSEARREDGGRGPGWHA